MPSGIPSVKVGASSMPVIGLGTWKSAPGDVKQAVKDAVDIGYRHFDCAYVYENEAEIGEAFAEKFKEGVIKREDIFVTSKVWNTFHAREKVHENMEKTLKALRFDYVDLYLIHWPVGYEASDELMPKDKDGNVRHSDVDYLETWKGMEDLHKAGKAKNIGLSNFNIEQIQRVLDNCTVAPTCLQIEVHVYLQNKKLIEFAKSKKLVVVAYSPLGSNDRPKGVGFGSYPPPLDDAVVEEIAEKNKRQPGQILLKFLLQQDLVIIPKSVHKDRLKSNLELFDFVLDKDDLAALEGLDAGGEYRCCNQSTDDNHKYYPFDRKYSEFN